MAGDKQRTKRLLTQVTKNPALVLEDKRCLKPHFCEGFFEICDDQALRDPPAALEFASYAVELGANTGDRHLMNQAASVPRCPGCCSWAAAGGLIRVRLLFRVSSCNTRIHKSPLRQERWQTAGILRTSSPTPNEISTQ